MTRTDAAGVPSGRQYGMYKRSGSTTGTSSSICGFHYPFGKTGARQPEGRDGRRSLTVALMLAVLAVLALGTASPAQALDSPYYGAVELVSTSHQNSNIYGDHMEFEAASKDGSRVLWTTKESLLAEDAPHAQFPDVVPDEDKNVDIYARIDHNTTVLVTPGNDFDATFEGISEDGSRVFFSTEEPIVGDSDTEMDYYVHDLDAVPPETRILTPNTDSGVMELEHINLAGNRVIFETRERLLAEDTDDEVDVYMSEDGAYTRISTGSRGGNDECGAFWVGSTPDGQHHFFNSREWLTEDDFGVDDEINTCRDSGGDLGTNDIFQWRDDSVVNRTPEPNIDGYTDGFGGVSDDGSRLIFAKAAIYESGKSCPNRDVYEVVIGATPVRLSPSPRDADDIGCSNGPPGSQYYNASTVGMSTDAKKVFWVSDEPEVGGNSDQHIDIFLSAGGVMSQLMSPYTPNADADYRWNTPDGEHLFFESFDPVIDDGDVSRDVFQNTNGTITKVSQGPLGGDGEPGETLPASNAYFLAATDDADLVFFSSNEKADQRRPGSGLQGRLPAPRR